MSDVLNSKLDPAKRPSLVDIEQQGLLPDNWLMDLYGLADRVRTLHGRMESTVANLKSKLNEPPILADVVAREEIETVDSYCTCSRRAPDRHRHSYSHTASSNTSSRSSSLRDATVGTASTTGNRSRNGSGSGNMSTSASASTKRRSSGTRSRSTR